MVYFGGFFSQTDIFAGFSLDILNLAVRISAALMAGDIIFLGCRTAYKGAIDGARSVEYYISKPLWSSGKIYAYGSPSSGLKKKRSSEAAMGGPRSSFRATRSSVKGCSVAQ